MMFVDFLFTCFCKLILINLTEGSTVPAYVLALYAMAMPEILFFFNTCYVCCPVRHCLLICICFLTCFTFELTSEKP